MTWWREKKKKNDVPSHQFFSVFIIKKKNFRKTKNKLKLYSHSFHLVKHWRERVLCWVCGGDVSRGGANCSDQHHQQEQRSAEKAAASSPDWPSHTFNPLMCPADNVSVSLDLRLTIRTGAGRSGFWLARRLSKFLRVQKSIQETGAGLGERCLQPAEKLDVLLFYLSTV